MAKQIFKIFEIKNIFMSLLIFTTMSCDSSSSYSIVIRDGTGEGENAVLDSLIIDDQKIGHISNVVLEPKKNVYQPVNVLYEFEKKGDFQINTKIFYKGELIDSKCIIQQEQSYQPYCLVYVSFDGTDALRCVCDF